jgi:putative ATPase
MTADPGHEPLPERCRPKNFEEFIGQRHILGKGKLLTRMLEEGRPFSMILWGDPGTGKTTLARLLARHFDLEAHFLSAVSAGVGDVRKVIEKGKKNREEGKQTLLFLDEIHRFNKAQQDAVLGAVEAGDIVLVGATTENPSFSVISPLLSRSRVLRFNRLEREDMDPIIDRALAEDDMFPADLVLEKDARDLLVENAGGDGRRVLNLLEAAFRISGESRIGSDNVAEAVKNSLIYYDRAGDRHYDTISAFIKSMRGSDPDAAVYYLARMVLAGEDPVFIARRMVIFASEDIGNAAPGALNLAVSCLTAVKNIGMPESDIILSQCAVFLASAPKSNASYLAIREAENRARDNLPEIPLHIRNAPTRLMKEMGYGREYRYPHDQPGHFVPGEEYLPGELRGEVFYRPTDQGSEKAVAERLEKLWPGRYGPPGRGTSSGEE